MISIIFVEKFTCLVKRSLFFISLPIKHIKNTAANNKTKFLYETWKQTEMGKKNNYFLDYYSMRGYAQKVKI